MRQRVVYVNLSGKNMIVCGLNLMIVIVFLYPVRNT